jgi:hypothetical protein
MNVADRAANFCKKRNLSGDPSNIKCHNSFSVLSDNEIISRTTRMGVNILKREMDKARNNMADKNNKNVNSLLIENVIGDKVPLSMDWASDDEFENDFTLVESRKSKKE